MATRRPALTIALFLLLSGTACTEYELACEPETFPSAPGVSGLSKCAANWERGFREGRSKGRYELRLLNADGTRVVIMNLPLDRGSGSVTITSASDAADRPETGWIESGANDLSNAPMYRSTTDSGEVEVTIDGRLPTDSSDGDATIEVDFGNPGITLAAEGSTAKISGSARVRATAQAVESGGPVGGGCGACAKYGAPENLAMNACDDGMEFSYDCYCTSAKMNYCMAATGCSTEPQTAYDEADRLAAAANEAALSGDPTCNPSKGY